MTYEKDYAKLISKTIDEGDKKETRNGETTSIFGTTLLIQGLQNGIFPLIQGRKMYPEGVFGELAAMLRKPKCLKDFEKWGCHYWRQWAKEDGSICIDYGNAWHADNQIVKLKNSLKNNPNDRRMLINGWRPSELSKLDLPCCHMMYQFYVDNNNTLHMLWYQRSVDLMVGLPSDVIFASAWLLAISNEFGYKPGDIKMVFGDTHVYKEHYEQAKLYIERVDNLHKTKLSLPKYIYNAVKGKDFCLFEPKDITILDYSHEDKINLVVKS